jgi:hypothetical protein
MTHRPQELRDRASQLRMQGWSVPRIATELGIAKSTAFLWVRHIPLAADEASRLRRREHAKAMTDARWEPHRQQRDRRRAEVHDDCATLVGKLSGRDLLLLGAAIYWCEGEKAKPWRRVERQSFVNSDVGLLRIFLRFLEAVGVDRGQPTYRVLIHETADADVAAAWWARELKIPPDRFRKPTIKRHVPTTVRHNVDCDYHGCLVIYVPRSRELYWRVEGVVQTIVAAGR